MKKLSLLLTAIIATCLVFAAACVSDEVQSISPQVGDNAPNFTLETIDGERISLSDFRGHIVLLVFTCTH